MSRLDDFLQNARDIAAASPHVSIDGARLKELAPDFAGASKPPSWNSYISDAARRDPPDMTRVVFEMAMICAQMGGFITPGQTGAPHKWQVGGSGAKAMLAKMQELRKEGVLPGIDFHDPAQTHEKIGPLMQGVPFANDRLAIFAEFAEPAAYGRLDALVKSAWKAGEGLYDFGLGFAEDLAAIFPRGFAGDPFLKKAVLTGLMTSAHAENRGVAVRTDPVIAADYVLPQVLEGLGILKLSDDLRGRLESRSGFAEDDDAVRDIRAATVTAAFDLARESGVRAQDIDSRLWLAGRDPSVQPRLLPAMNVYTMWF